MEIYHCVGFAVEAIYFEKCFDFVHELLDHGSLHYFATHAKILMNYINREKFVIFFICVAR